MPRAPIPALRIVPPTTEAERASVFDLRYRVLRAPWQQPRGTETDALDTAPPPPNSPWVLNLAAFDANGNALACGRVQALDAATAQVRYMAVDPDNQGSGLGLAVLNALEAAAAAHGHSTVVLEAREKALGFYERAGYAIVAKTHLLFGSIQHWRMQKRLVGTLEYPASY